MNLKPTGWKEEPYSIDIISIIILVILTPLFGGVFFLSLYLKEYPSATLFGCFTIICFRWFYLIDSLERGEK